MTQKLTTQFPASSRKNLPFPSFPKKGLKKRGKIPPLKNLKKGDKGGFEFAFSG
jgi:hypothetical protein